MFSHGWKFLEIYESTPIVRNLTSCYFLLYCNNTTTAKQAPRPVFPTVQPALASIVAFGSEQAAGAADKMIAPYSQLSWATWTRQCGEWLPSNRCLSRSRNEQYTWKWSTFQTIYCKILWLLLNSELIPRYYPGISIHVVLVIYQ